MKGTYFTEEQKEFIISHIETMTDREIAAALGVSYGGIRGFKSRNKLYRSPERIAELNRQKSLGRKQTNPNSLANLKPNPDNFKKLSDEARELRNRHAIENRNKVIQAERRRLLFGLPQQTRIKLYDDSRRERSEVYWRLKRAGYTYLGYSRFMVPEKRHPRMEKFASERYKIKFVETEN